MKQSSGKSVQITSVCYSSAKSTLKTLLTFSKVEKTKHKNFNFLHLLSFFLPFFFLFSSLPPSLPPFLPSFLPSFIPSFLPFSYPPFLTPKVYVVQECLTYLTLGLLLEIFSTGFHLRVSYDWRAMVSKLSPTRFAFSFVRLTFQAIIVWGWHVLSGHTRTIECERRTQR